MHISRCLQSTRPEAGLCTQQHTLPKRSESQGKSDSSEAKLTRPASTGPLLPLAPQTGNKHHQRAGLRAAVPSLLPLSPPVTVPKQEGELGELRTGGKRARLGNQRALRARAPRPAAGTAPPGSRGCGRGSPSTAAARAQPSLGPARGARCGAAQKQPGGEHKAHARGTPEAGLRLATRNRGSGRAVHDGSCSFLPPPCGQGRSRETDPDRVPPRPDSHIQLKQAPSTLF